jgi:hypothetical protein
MSDWKQDVQEAAERIPSSREMEEKASRLEDKAARATARVAEGLREAEGRVREMGRSAGETLGRTCDELATVARQNPGTTTLVAFGAGIGTGLWFANRRTSRWRSAVPAVAAVADAVIEILDRRR